MSNEKDDDKDHRGRPIPQEFILAIGDYTQNVLDPNQKGAIDAAKASGYTVVGPYRLVKKKKRVRQAKGTTTGKGGKASKKR